jgi:hypothetical protein
MTPSTGERRPRPPPPSPPTRAGEGFRPACLAYNTLTYLRQQPLPAAYGNAPARKMAHHSPQLHHGAISAPLYWRQGASSTDHPSTATAAAPNPTAPSRGGGKCPPRLRVTSLYADRRHTPAATAHYGHATSSTHGQAEPEAPNRSSRPPPLCLASRKPPPPSPVTCLSSPVPSPSSVSMTVMGRREGLGVNKLK